MVSWMKAIGMALAVFAGVALFIRATAFLLDHLGTFWGTTVMFAAIFIASVLAFKMIDDL